MHYFTVSSEILGAVYILRPRCGLSRRSEIPASALVSAADRVRCTAGARRRYRESRDDEDARHARRCGEEDSP